jgi:dTDP-4-amino-4,6-dideoxygalactose transaminase
METIGELARRYGFSVLEDASHAVGAKYQNEPVGNCRHSSICVFSFHPVKIITTGEGGMATTNDPNLARHMADLRSHGITKDPERFERPAPGAWAYEQQELGYNYRMTDIQAALGLSQLERLDSIISERQQQLTYYSEILRDLPLRILQIPKNAESSVHLAVIQLNETMLHGQIFNELRNNGIGVQMHYTPVHLQPYYRRLGFKEGQFPNAERYSKCSISIPLYPGLTKSEQERVAETLSKLLRI